MKERDELDGVTAASELDELCVFSSSGMLECFLRLNTWTVPLSLETASHWAVEENAKLQISAVFAPLLTWMRHPINFIPENQNV